MPFVQTADATLSYTVRGQGERTLLLIAGLGCQASEWGDPFLTRLSSRVRVVCFDNRGIGESETRVDAFTMDDMAMDAAAVLDALGIARADVAGTSMGGMIAQSLACALPERVDRLVMMATHSGGDDLVASAPDATLALVPQLGLSIGQMQHRVLTALTAPGFAAAHPDVIAEQVELRNRCPTRRRVFNAQCEAIIASDRRQGVRELRQPTLVMHGVDDPLIPIENGRRLAASISSAGRVWFDDCGHFPHFEKPEACANAILEFLLRPE